MQNRQKVTSRKSSYLKQRETGENLFQTCWKCFSCVSQTAPELIPGFNSRRHVTTPTHVRHFQWHNVCVISQLFSSCQMYFIKQTRWHFEWLLVNMKMQRWRQRRRQVYDSHGYWGTDWLSQLIRDTSAVMLRDNIHTWQSLDWTILGQEGR